MGGLFGFAGVFFAISKSLKVIACSVDHFAQEFDEPLSKLLRRRYCLSTVECPLRCSKQRTTRKVPLLSGAQDLDVFKGQF